MNDLSPILSQLVPFVMVLFRVAGLFLFAPVVGSVGIPLRTMALLSLVFSAALYPTLRADLALPAQVDLFTLGALIATETLIGVTIGLLMSLPFTALQLAGYIMGHQMGLGLAQVYNPEVDADADVIGQLLFYLSLAVFLTVGGLEGMFIALLDTFERVPVGAYTVDLMPLDLVVAVLSSGYELALRVSAPVVGMILLLLLAMGFIMKTMPQINVLTIGFAIKILAGVTIFASAVLVVSKAAEGEIVMVMDEVFGWVRSL